MNRRRFVSALAAGPLAAAAADGKKYLIVHADDAGMCHSANIATIEAMEKGLVSSASVMMPCPWVQEFTEWARTHPEKDVGLHLTLTSEWRYYRWRPVAPQDKVRGLLDKEGYMSRDVRSTAMNAKPEEIETELRAQIERASQYGVRFTHLDSHMGTLFARPDYFEIYVKLADEYGVPCMLPRPNEANAADLKGYPITPEMLREKEQAGLKMLDRLILGVPGRTPAERRESYLKLIGDLKPGVTKLIVHLAKDDAEIRAITNSWEQRWGDFLFWTSDAARRALEKHNVELYTYRRLAGS
jgi:predicted glycoside hydrolase/deacetylase ChbG (UPF0249 family)